MRITWEYVFQSAIILPCVFAIYFNYKWWSPQCSFHIFWLPVLSVSSDALLEILPVNNVVIMLSLYVMLSLRFLRIIYPSRPIHSQHLLKSQGSIIQTQIYALQCIMGKILCKRASGMWITLCSGYSVVCLDWLGQKPGCSFTQQEWFWWAQMSWTGIIAHICTYVQYTFITKKCSR